jgi:malic enzyme
MNDDFRKCSEIIKQHSLRLTPGVLYNVQGLLVESRKESLQHFKKPFAHEHEPLKTLLEAVQSLKPTVLIGTSGVGKTFTQEVVEAMASFNEVQTYTLAIHLSLIRLWFSLPLIS